MNNDDIEQWKEINASIRHWETLLFENAKSYFAAVTIAIGAAGASIAWTTVPRTQQRIAILIFLGAATVVSLFALVAVDSQRRYLLRFYARRTEFKSKGLIICVGGRGTGKTIPVVLGGFAAGIVLSGCLFCVALSGIGSEPLLKGARLAGADLSAVAGLRQGDVEGACGDTLTKLPQGLAVARCK